ncbi:TPA: hypothetical protein N3M87_001545 [Klebsiella aerogenes]|nr:hypothetical protein [Klebsiella aerogenes]
MPLILLWVGLALLPGFIASGNGHSFRGWLSTRYLPTWCSGYRQEVHTKTPLRLPGKATRWFITLIIFMTCLLFITSTPGDMAGF